jgi:hypothetical protein
MGIPSPALVFLFPFIFRKESFCQLFADLGDQKFLEDGSTEKISLDGRTRRISWKIIGICDQSVTFPML